MLDPSTGTLTLDYPQAVLGPSLTRDAFLAGPLAAFARTDVANEPNHSWKFDSPFRAAGIDWLVVIYFNGQRLTSVSLMNSDPRFGRSWADASREKELSRKASHDRSLAACMGPRRDFVWGSVASVYDPKSECSSIGIHYSTQHC